VTFDSTRTPRNRNDVTVPLTTAQMTLDLVLVGFPSSKAAASCVANCVRQILSRWAPFP
jgi:hypothetical protein